MLLQRELAAGLHDDALDPVAGGDVHVLVVAPGTVDAPVLDRRAMVLRLELLDQRLDLLGLRARSDQHGVRGRHDDDVVEPDHGGQHGLLRTHQAVAAVQHDDRTVGRIAGGVMVEHIPDRAPAADVRPAEIGGNHGGELGALHDGIVDRLLRRARERLGREPQEIEVAREAGDRRLGGLRHRRLEALDLAQHGGGVKQEIAAVPEIAIRHVARGGRGIGLFHERLDRAHGCAVELLARTDVAVVRRGIGGLDAEGDDPALGGGAGGAPAGFAELVGLANDVVGREHQHERIAVALGREHGGDRDRGAGIAAHRLQHDVGLDAALAQLLGHDEAEIGTGDDDRAREQVGVGNAREHLLERRSLADQGDELLRHAFARDRPQPRSRAAAHDHRDDLSRHERKILDCCDTSSRPGANRQAAPGVFGQRAGSTQKLHAKEH